MEPIEVPQGEEKNGENENKQNTSGSKEKPKENRSGKPAKKGLKTFNLYNGIVLVIVLICLFFVGRSFYSIGNGRYTNASQVEAFINPLNTRVSAYIKEIRFVEHQYVKKGDTLLILDDREIQTQLGQAEATYMSALASKNATTTSIKTTENIVNTGSANVNVAKANIASAQAKLWNAEQNFKRYQNLLKDEAVTRQQFDQVKSDYQAQKAQLEMQISQYQAALNTKETNALSVNEAQAKIGVNDAEIKKSENALNMAKLNLSYTVITAPHDGIMGRRTVNVGQLLTTSQQVATIVDINNIWITANYREKQMENVKVGRLATIKVDALNGQEFEGKVTAISGATGARYSAVPVDNSTGNFVKVQQRIPVRIEFTNNNQTEALKALRAGMNVEVTLQK